MEYTLMHKSIPVFGIELDEARKEAVLSAYTSRLEQLQKSCG